MLRSRSISFSAIYLFYIVRHHPSEHPLSFIFVFLRFSYKILYFCYVKLCYIQNKMLGGNPMSQKSITSSVMEYRWWS